MAAEGPTTEKLLAEYDRLKNVIGKLESGINAMKTNAKNEGREFQGSTSYAQSRLQNEQAMKRIRDTLLERGIDPEKQVEQKPKPKI